MISKIATDCIAISHMNKVNIYLVLLSLLIGWSTVAAQMLPSYVSTVPIANGFTLSENGRTSPIYFDREEHKPVVRAIDDFQQDIMAVSTFRPDVKVYLDAFPSSDKEIIIVGTIGKNKLIDQLIQEGKIAVEGLRGCWETFSIQMIEQPFAGIEKALIIIGSDMRGTLYGIYDISKNIGVSPWYWWADVPIPQQTALYIQPGIHSSGSPAVKFRGFFINDEAPALANWAKERFGGFNHQFYAKVFELMLRLKANYLWPAMWGSAFYDDDPLNSKTAAEYGIVIGTSHHEPMARAHDEWRRYGKGPWDYQTNASKLKAFWKKGIARINTNEHIVTIGMRGDGDEPMTQGTAIAMLENIIQEQRNIIAEVSGKKPTEVSQLWALYKEVQDYYDQGMRVPDDVTLLLCDDNWGNVRKLPDLKAPKRSGGYGMYYHFDYVGGPRNYKWINTNPIPRIWEQMHLSYQYGVDQIWIVNVGDIKPMELPISFFLDYAWAPRRWNAQNLHQYTQQWAAQQFGHSHADEIAIILDKYTRYNGRRKPELLSPETYSVINYNEADRIIAAFDEIRNQANTIYSKLPSANRDAYYQLVLFPVLASANINELYIAAGKNRYYAERNDPLANFFAKQVEELFAKDQELTNQYHTAIAKGKWNHMMSQTHIGYTYWQQPDKNEIPEIRRMEETHTDTLHPPSVAVKDRPFNEKNEEHYKRGSFIDEEGYVAIEALHFTENNPSDALSWHTLPGFGRTCGAVTPFPVTSHRISLNENSAYLSYSFQSKHIGAIKLHTYLSPTLDFRNQDGLQYAISVDDELPQIININAKDDELWEQYVADNIKILESAHRLLRPGKHTIKLWALDPGVVIQRLVIDLGGLKPSYLGPPESNFVKQ